MPGKPQSRTTIGKNSCSQAAHAHAWFVTGCHGQPRARWQVVKDRVEDLDRLSLTQHVDVVEHEDE